MSAHYEKLKANIEKLANHFLPAAQDPEGNYSEGDYLNLFAFIALSHSEIEYYLENTTKEIALTAIRLFKTQQKATKAMLGLVCFSDLSFSLAPSSKKPENCKQEDWDQKIQLEKKLDRAINSFITRVKNNNGIKEKDFLDLFLSIGFPTELIDDIFLTELNLFGETRGSIAHSSTADNMATLKIDPFIQKKKVDELLKQLEIIDNSLSVLVA